jgi:hypothetical protein
MPSKSPLSENVAPAESEGRSSKALR